jgi:hypothetical protein
MYVSELATSVLSVTARINRSRLRIKLSHDLQADALPSAGVTDHVLTPIEIAGLVD